MEGQVSGRLLKERLLCKRLRKPVSFWGRVEVGRRLRNSGRSNVVEDAWQLEVRRS